MTETEWLTSTDLWEMLKHVQPHCGRRKLRLLAVACCRCLDELLRDPEIRAALDAAEQYADGRIQDSVLGDCSRRATEARERLRQSLLSPQYMAYNLVVTATWIGGYADSLGGVPGGVSQAVATWSGHSWGTAPWEEVQQQAAKHLHTLVTEVIGNPFWLVVFNPSWRTADVLGLAQKLYESREFQAMPILGDALEDAGCDNTDILNHCRGSGPHVRGCWVLDLVLDKK